jgi:hypothetical protein
MMLGGILTDKLKQYHSTISVRKTILSIGKRKLMLVLFSCIDVFFLALLISSLAFLLIVLLNTEQRPLIVVSIIIAVAGSSLSTSTFMVSHLEIGAQYAGFLMGLSNGGASVPGFLMPLLTAEFVPDTYVRTNII